MSTTSETSGKVVFVVGTIYPFVKKEKQHMDITLARIVHLLIGRWLNYLPTASAFVREARIKWLVKSKEFFLEGNQFGFQLEIMALKFLLKFTTG